MSATIQWTPVEGNFTEDYGSENGCYENACCICRRHFYGNKHRVVCKICETEAPKGEPLSQEDFAKVIAEAFGKQRPLATWEREALDSFTHEELRKP